MIEAGLVYLNHILGAHSNIIDLCVGNGFSVEFDFLKISKNLKKNNFKNLTFIHSHPEMAGVELSATDINCVKGYFQAFPKWLTKFNFNVINFEGNSFGLHLCERDGGVFSSFSSIDDAIRLGFVCREYVDILDLISHSNEKQDMNKFLYLLERL